MPRIIRKTSRGISPPAIGVPVPGTEIKLVPTGDKDRFAVYVSCATIDHEENQREVEHALASLRFDG